MKLLIVRHGDPDYSIDSLTPQGLARGRTAQKQADEARCCGVLLLAARQGEGHFKSDAQRARQNGGDIRLAARVRRLCNRPGERGAHLFLGQNACVSERKRRLLRQGQVDINSVLQQRGCARKIQNRLRRHRRAACAPRLYSRRQDIQSRAGEQRHRGALLPFRRGVRSALAYFKDIARCALA